MRELLLLRHAKSRWDAPATGDHDRDLASRGLDAAARMGVEIARRGWVPRLVLCSTARRARHTLELARAAWPQTPEIEHERALYLASPERMLQILATRPAAPERSMLVGHNPGMHQLARRLAVRGDAAILAELHEKFPTGALARLAFDVPDWSCLENGILLDFVRPRSLRHTD
ncbi:MAG: histidine phosphatase family protein [Geminicoccaceae bacterium]|nr:histidine phosphatase family protein [Geminicoccaceae bacterium]